jgi:hypothetical protein
MSDVALYDADVVLYGAVSDVVLYSADVEL